MTALDIAPSSGGLTTTTSISAEAIKLKLEQFMPQLQELFQKVLDHFSSHKEEMKPAENEHHFHVMTIDEFKQKLDALKTHFDEMNETLAHKFAESHPDLVAKYREFVAKLEEIGASFPHHHNTEQAEAPSKLKQFADETITKLRGAFHHQEVSATGTAAQNL